MDGVEDESKLVSCLRSIAPDHRKSLRGGVSGEKRTEARNGLPGQL